jgi:hypothetical protein
MQMLYIVRDYGRLREKCEDGRGDELARRRVDSIEQAVQELSPEYRNGVFRYSVYGDCFPIVAGSATWKRQLQKFIWNVARLLGELDCPQEEVTAFGEGKTQRSVEPGL